jgi:hypothetical protein
MPPFSYLSFFLARGNFCDNGKKKGMISISEGIKRITLKY